MNKRHTNPKHGFTVLPTESNLSDDDPLCVFPEEQGDEQPVPPTDPAEVAAKVMLDRALAEHPELLTLGQRLGSAIIVEIPSSSWVRPLVSAWETALQGEDWAWEAEEATPRWSPRPSAPRRVRLVRDGEQKSPKADQGDLVVITTLAYGGSVVGFASSPDRDLPSALLRAADLRVAIPPLTGTAVTQALAVIKGCDPADVPDLGCQGAIEADDLRLACRAEEDAAAAIVRLRGLISDRVTPPDITLDEVHGMEEAVAWGQALATDLADYRKGAIPWSAVDRGVLLYGPPGTGKTTYARALAGTTGLPLIAASLGEWQAAGHLGDLLKAMRTSFDTARAQAPAILFIDEIDSFGNRADLSHNNRDYSIQVINGFLELLDGITGREGVVVVGACNHPHRLDPAITRSGRLDRSIHIPLPDTPALARILRHHLKNDLAEADLAVLAMRAFGGTGADCERWVRGARRRARQSRRAMIPADLEAEINGNQLVLPPQRRHRCAVHEAGHAVTTALLNPDSLIRATIRTTETTGGGVQYDPRAMRLDTAEEVRATLVQWLAGRAAEEVVLGSVSSGAGGTAESDLARATFLAVISITALGLHPDTALVWRGMPDSSEVAVWLGRHPDLAKAVSGILEHAYDAAKALIRDHRPSVERVVDDLLRHETVDAPAIIAVVGAVQPQSARGVRRSIKYF